MKTRIFLSFIFALITCAGFAQQKINEVAIERGLSKDTMWIPLSDTNHNKYRYGKFKCFKWDSLKNTLGGAGGGFFTPSTATGNTTQNCDTTSFSIIDPSSFYIGREDETNSIYYFDYLQDPYFVINVADTSGNLASLLVRDNYIHQIVPTSTSTHVFDLNSEGTDQWLLYDVDNNTSSITYTSPGQINAVATSELDINSPTVKFKTEAYPHGLIKLENNIVTIGDTFDEGNSTILTIDDINEAIKLSNVKIFTDDAAAAIGGLTAGTIYKTATGVLMIKL